MEQGIVRAREGAGQPRVGHAPEAREGQRGPQLADARPRLRAPPVDVRPAAASRPEKRTRAPVPRVGEPLELEEHGVGRTGMVPEPGPVGARGRVPRVAVLRLRRRRDVRDRRAAREAARERTA